MPWLSSPELLFEHWKGWNNVSVAVSEQKMSRLFQEFNSEVTEMGPKLLRGDIGLCRKLNLSKLLGNTNSSSACPKSHWNFCPGAAQVEQDSPWAGATPIPGQNLEEN